MNEVVKIENLSITFKKNNDVLHAVRNASFTLKQGEILAIVGESGCGKSVCVQSLLKLNSSPQIHYTGNVFLNGEDVLPLHEKDMQKIRGKLASIIFQNPMTSLNPTMKIKHQLMETIYVQRRCTKKECYQEALSLLEKVHIQDPSQRMELFPHQLSGGMIQRVMIAMALASKPQVLIADEPTTSLDVSIQAQIMQLLTQLNQEYGMAILLVTHDLTVAKHFAHNIAVMYAGRIVEKTTAKELFDHPTHPYTKALLHCHAALNDQKNSELPFLNGLPPQVYNDSVGCAFAPRCDACMNICLSDEPPLIQLNAHHDAQCFLLHPEHRKAKEES